jgi:hypothetical protein
MGNGGPEEAKIMGVEHSIIEEFFKLVKEKYPLVDKANYFLELNLGVSGINVAITNQRDVLSHLCTIITDTTLTYQQKLDQISNADEHLRRAILESYEKAVSLVIDNINNLFDLYKLKVIRYKARDSTLNSAPDTVSVRAILRELSDMRTKGRDAKRRNKWDAEWEEGVEILLKAFNKAKELEVDLESYLARADQIKTNKKQTFLSIWGIIATLLTFILGIALVLLWK